MKLHSLAGIALLSAALVGTPAVSTLASAQPSSGAQPSPFADAAPVALWTIAGGIVGAIAWPAIVGAGPATAATVGYLNLGIPIGGIVGALGYKLIGATPDKGVRP